MYAGSTVELTFDLIRYDGQEYHWSYTYTMSGPRNETFISGSGFSEYIQYVQIRQTHYQSESKLHEAKLDPDGSFLEECNN